MVKILIVGANGFLGKSITSRLLDGDENFQALGLIDSTSITESVGGPRVEILQVDWVNSDVESLALTVANYDVWVIAAGRLPFGGKDSEFQINDGIAKRTADLFELVSSAYETSPFIIFISSSSIYGYPLSHPYTKDSPVNPVGEYARSKLRAEQILAQIPYSTLAVIRPRTILGPSRAGTGKWLRRMVKSGIPIPLPPGDPILQVCHVDDLVSLILHLATSNEGGIWPAFSRDATSLREYLLTYAKRANVKIRVFGIGNLAARIAARFATRGGKFGPFSEWHYAGYFFNHAFDERWVPSDFSPERTCTDAVIETLEQP